MVTKVIDDDYTQFIKDTHAAGEDFMGPIYTEDEVDWLLDNDASADPTYTTRLTEVAIERTTGLKVDLANQGPARTAVFQNPYAEFQEHNVYVTQETTTSLRNFPSHMIDRDTVPSVTKQDANIAVNSIDWPGMRPRGTPLDNMRIDVKDNPYEKAFINQIVTLQVLHHWGMDVDSMIDWMDRHWSIDYTGALVRDVALARVADLEEFLASGGRPTPASYISVNIMSRYTVVTCPTTDYSHLGVTNPFMSRYRMAAKFIHATVNICRGDKYKTFSELYVNPTQMSKFHPSQLVGWDTSVDADSANVVTVGRASIAGIDSYDAFIDCRYPLKAVKRDADVVLSARFDRRVARPAGLLGPGLTLQQRIVKYSIMDTGHEVRRDAYRVNEASYPSRILAIITGVFHGTAPLATNFDLAHGYCDMFAILHSMDKDYKTFADLWMEISRVPCIAPALANINVQRLLERADFEVVKTFDTNARIACISYAFYRASASMRETFVLAYRAVAQWIISSKPPTQLENAKNCGYYIAHIPRISKMLSAVLGRIYRQKPYTYVAGVARAGVVSAGRSSLLAAIKSEMNAVLRIDDEWVDFHECKKRKTDDKKYVQRRLRPVFATLRNGWVDFYRKQMVVKAHMLKILVAHGGPNLMKVCGVVSGADMEDTVDTCAVLANGLLTEVGVAMGRMLAYKWAAITIKGITRENVSSPAPEDVVDAFVETYTALLKTTATPDELTSVDMKVGQLDKNSGLAKEITAFADDIALGVCTDTRVAYRLSTYLKQVCRVVYKDSGWAVHSTIAEAVENDQLYVRDVDLAEQIAKISNREPELVAVPVPDVGNKAVVHTVALKDAIVDSTDEEHKKAVVEDMPDDLLAAFMSKPVIKEKRSDLGTRFADACYSAEYVLADADEEMADAVIQLSKDIPDEELEERVELAKEFIMILRDLVIEDDVDYTRVNMKKVRTLYNKLSNERVEQLKHIMTS